MKYNLTKKENMKTLQKRKEVSDEICKEYRANMFSLIEFVRNYYSLSVREFLPLIGMQPSSGGSYARWRTNDLSLINAETILRFCLVFGIDIDTLCEVVRSEAGDCKSENPLAAYTAFKALSDDEKQSFIRAVVKQGTSENDKGNSKSDISATKKERNANIYQAYLNGTPCSELASQYGLTVYSIYNIVSNRRKQLAADEKTKIEKEIYEQYMQGITEDDLAEKYDMSRDQICEIIVCEKASSDENMNSGQEIIAPIPDSSKSKEKRNQQIYSAYKNGMDIQKIAKSFNIAVSSVYRIISSMNGSVDTTAQKEALEKRNQQIIQERKDGVSAKDLAIKYNVSVSNIYRLLRDSEF